LVAAVAVASRRANVFDKQSDRHLVVHPVTLNYGWLDATTVGPVGPVGAVG
jgi:hypothetical protein